MHKRRKTSGVHASSHKPMKKVCNENETNKNKQRARKSVIDERKLFIGHIQKTDKNNLDKLGVNNSGHNEGTICLVNG